MFHGPLSLILGELHPLRIGLAGFAYYCTNTVLIAGVIAEASGVAADSDPITFSAGT